jgi:ketosteroid isomerase-like protein
MGNLTTQAFDKWLRDYGAAWESRDPRAASALFTADAQYFWTPFDPPQRGSEEIAAAWQGAVSQQENVRFTCEVLAVNGETGVAHWHVSFDAPGERVNLDGMFVVEFAANLQCRTFREWWHRAATPS